MSSTKRILSDIVLTRLQAGWPDISGAVQKQDVWKAIEQKVNSIFKLSQFKVNLPNGSTIPDNLAMATYTDVPVTTYASGQKSIATLPVMPISLPRNVGIFGVDVAMSLGLNLGWSFIPLQAGQNNLLRTDFLLNNLMGDVGYEPYGNKIVITKDVTVYKVTKLDFQLIVFDISNYSETDILPIPADYEQQIIDELMVEFSPIQAVPELVSNYPGANTPNTVTK